ncbi:hypothetical protein ACFLSH_00755 [Bacteroidota bacterium]
MTNKFKTTGFIKAAFILMIILGGMGTYGISNGDQNITENEDIQNSTVMYNVDDNHARDIATIIVYKLFNRLSKYAAYRVTSPVTETMYGGEAAYTVTDTYIGNENLIEIKVFAKVNDVTNIITYNIDKETKRKKSINIRFEYE